MSSAAGDRPLIEMGAAPHPRAGRGRRLARRVRRRLRHHLRPGGRFPLRHPHRRHQRARLHPAARQRARRLRGPGRLARPGHDAAGGHLRRRRGGPHRRGGRRARSSARSASTPATCCCRPPGARSSSTSWAPATPGSSSPPTSTSTPSPRWPRRRRRLRRRHRAGDRLRRPDLLDGLQAGRPRRRDQQAPLVPVAKKQRAARPRVGGRKWAARRLDARRRRRGRGDRHRRVPADDGATASCWSSWCGAARSSAAGPPTEAATAAARARRAPSCRQRPHQLSRGEPAIPTVYEDRTRAHRRRLATVASHAATAHAR